jgi:hypothetical protein
LFLFQFANASILPLAGEELVYRNRTRASLIISTLIIVSQIVVALTAPWAGREAQNWGRGPLLLLRFGALTFRALFFAVTINPWLLLFTQLLDGITGSTLGVPTALIVADFTKGTGRFNLAQALFGRSRASAIAQHDILQPRRGKRWRRDWVHQHCLCSAELGPYRLVLDAGNHAVKRQAASATLDSDGSTGLPCVQLQSH